MHPFKAGLDDSDQQTQKHTEQKRHNHVYSLMNTGLFSDVIFGKPKGLKFKLKTTITCMIFP